MDFLTQLGQKFAVGFPGFSIPDETRKIIKDYKIGNIILFKHNVESRAQLKQLCLEINTLVVETTGIKPFIMIDQEGGMVTRLSSDFINIPGAMALSATDDVASIYNCAKITGDELLEVGVNCNLAPVLDINSNDYNPVIGVRSYGEDSESVIKYSASMIKGLEDSGVLSCGKHFPGHGDTAVDSHLGLPIVDKSLDDLYQGELKPFIAAIKKGIPAIMTTHILFPQLDSTRLPATLNKTILTSLLREKLGFKGLIITDCMEMGAIAKEFGTVEAIKTTFLAGSDIACVSHHADKAQAAIENILKTGIDEALVEDSCIRILSFKAKYLVDNKAQETAVNATNIDRVKTIRENTITEYSGERKPFKANPIFISCYPFVVTLASNPENQELCFASLMQASFGGDKLINSIDPTDEEINTILEKAKGHTSVILGTYNGHIKKGQIKLAKALATLDIPLTVVALRNPYDLKDLPDNVYSIALYEYSKESIESLISYLKTNKINRNRIPFLTRSK